MLFRSLKNAHEGRRFLALNDTEATSTATSVSVKAAPTGTATLSFWYCIASDETAATAVDVLRVALYADGTEASFVEFSNLQQMVPHGAKQCDWAEGQLTAPAAGVDSWSVKASTSMTGNIPTTFYIDSVSLKACPLPPLFFSPLPLFVDSNSVELPFPLMVDAKIDCNE